MIMLNHGEEIMSNLFVIGISLICFPIFLWAANNEMTSHIRLESSILFLLAVISTMRLINRIVPLPAVVNGLIAIIAFGILTGLTVAGIIRRTAKYKK